MKNLACNSRTDEVILYTTEQCRHELIQAKIVVVEGEIPEHTEVPSRVQGQLGAFTFRRAWYYWVAKGPMPLALADEIYADPARDDIRAHGFAGGIEPRHPPFADYYEVVDGKLGKKLTTKDQEDEFLKHCRPGLFKPEDFYNQFKVVDDPTKGYGIVSAYHIDSSLGLRLFSDYVRNYVEKGGSILEWKEPQE